MLEHRPRRRQRKPDVHRVTSASAHPRHLLGQRRLALRRNHPRHHTGLDRRGPGHHRLGRSLLQDHVRVRATDPEGRHTGPARPVHRRPPGRFGEQGNRAGLPVHVRRRLVDVEGARRDAVSQRLHHLDHPGHPGRGLGVPEVGLDRPEQQRGFPIPAVGRQQGLRLDRVTQPRTRAVPLDHVDVRRGQPGGRQCLADHPLLRRPVGRGEAVGRAVGVDRRTRDDGQHVVTVAAGVGQALQHQHAGALGPAGAVRAVGVGLAPPVLGQATLAAELGEGHRRRHHGHATGQGQRAVAGAQRLRRQVQRDQGGGAGGVDRHRRALQAEGVGQPAGDHADRGAGHHEPLGRRVAEQQAGVVGVGGADVDAGGRAGQRQRVDAGPLDRFPRGFQQHPLLRVHGDGLARRDAEESRVEPGGVLEETTDRGQRHGVALRRVPAGVLPAAVARETGDHVPAVHDQLPQVFGRVDPARVVAAHADDGDPVVVRSGAGGHRGHTGSGGGHGLAEHLGEQERGQPDRGRVVEHQGRGQPLPGGTGQPVAQLDRAERVEPELPEFLFRADEVHRGVTEHGGRLAADDAQQVLVPVRRAHSGQFRGQAARCERAGRGGGAAGAADQVAQNGRDRALGRGRAPRGGHQHRLVGGDRGVEHGHARPGFDAGEAGGGGPAAVGLGQPGGHAAGAGPRAPGHRGGRQAEPVPVAGQRVHGHVGGGVAALAGAADQAGGRGVQHERGQRLVEGGLVQVPGGVHLGRQHGVQALRGDRAEYSVGHHPGRVHHRGDGPAVDQLAHGGRVADVAGGDGHGVAQFRRQFGRAGRGRAAAAGQQQVPLALGDEVPGQVRGQPAGAAGDQHGRVTVPDRWHGQHELADVLGLRHEPERVPAAADVPGGDRQWLQRAPREQPEQRGQHFAHPVRAGLGQVERPVPDTRRALPDVGLAHLQEVPTGLQQTQRSIDELTGQRIQHHVQTRTSQRRKRPLEVRRTRRSDVIIGNTHSPHRVLLGRARRSEHLRPQMLRQLHSGHTHTTGSGVHQYLLPGPQVGQVG